MKKTLWILGLLGVLGVPLAAASDDCSMSPATSHTVVFARWGVGEGELTPRGESWGVAEAARFGSFCVDAHGAVYIADESNNVVNIYSARGDFMRSVDLGVDRNLVDDILVDGDRIYWLREWPGRPTRVYYIDQSDGVSNSIELNSTPELTTDFEGRRFARNCTLIKEGDGISVFGRQRWAAISIMENSVPVPVEQQLTTLRRGYPVRGGRIMHVSSPGASKASGGVGGLGSLVFWSDNEKSTVPRREVRAALVAIGPSHCLFETLVESAGGWCPCWLLTDLDGRELSRTPMPISSSARCVEPQTRLRLQDDGSWYYLVVEDEGVRVEHYMFNSGREDK